MWGEAAHLLWLLREHLNRGVAWAPVWSLLSILLASHQQATGPRWASEFFAVVFSAPKKNIAGNFFSAATQNVVVYKEFIRGRQQAMGVSVRKADGGPKTSLF